jgi:hypothetical protein
MIFPHRRRDSGGSIMAALVMLVIGFMFLAGTMLPGWSIGTMFGRGWPFIVIAVGFASLIGNLVRAPFRGRVSIGGPMIVITVGALFALQNFMRIGFDRTWPILLIVIAIGIVLKKVLMLPFLPFLRRRL